jgi:hypothetical protein
MFPFAYLTGFNQDPHARSIEVSEERLRVLLNPLIELVHVDEEWYRSSNLDVASAIKAGILRSAREHYKTAGYYEDRLPHPVTVDERWYLREYPDVAEALRTGQLYSAQRHFETAGFREGRRPFEGWSLITSMSTDKRADKRL